jgi:hypothetical protein
MIWIVIAVLVVAACVAVPLYLDWRHTRQSTFPREVAPLVFPMPGPEGRETVSREVRPAPVERAVPIETVTARSVSASKPIETAAALLPMAPHDTVQFRRPSEEVLQLLPGRLEVLSGIAGPREIRFVRVPGEQPQLILGREPGPSPPHVALPSGTVSRQHARLDFSGGRWGLTNLSRTNPVVVNDEALSNVQGQRPLVDGDRIELGDVVLRFFAR